MDWFNNSNPSKGGFGGNVTQKHNGGESISISVGIEPKTGDKITSKNGKRLVHSAKNGDVITSKAPDWW